MPHAPTRMELLVHLRRSEGATPAASAGLVLARKLEAWVTGPHVVPIAAAAFASPEDADRFGNALLARIPEAARARSVEAAPTAS